MLDKETRQAKILEDLAVVERQMVPAFAPASEEDQAQITVLLTTSPMPSHPSPWVVGNVHNSIRRHLPNSRILVLADGVTGEEPGTYTEFKKNAKELGWELVEFAGKHHQSLMMRDVLLSGMITTPLVIAGDGDWGFHKRYMDWRGIVATLLDSESQFKSIQIRQDNIGVWELAWDVFRDLQSEHGIYLLPTTCFQGPTSISRIDWWQKMALSLKVPDFLECDELRAVMYETGGINQMGAYIPPGPIGRIYHLNGQHVLRPEQLGGIGDL